MTEHIKIEHKDHLLTLTFARPDKKNALTNAMYGALADAILSAETDAKTRVIVLRGEGDMFTAGNDVGEFASWRPATSAASAMSRASSTRSRARPSRWLPRCRAVRSASAPPCCCIATSSCWPITRCCPRRSSAWRWCRRPLPACCCRCASAMRARTRCSRSARRSTPKPRSRSASPTAWCRSTSCTPKRPQSPRGSRSSRPARSPRPSG